MTRTLPLLLLIPLLTACLPTEPTRTGEGSPARVASVVDGDTVELADGRRVRYIGIDTPEVDQPYAADATALNRSLVEGQDVWLETDAQPTDQYGRLLAYVWAGDTFVNLELVRQGYATAYTVPPNVRHADAFVQAEREAREAGRGLWAPAGVPIRITALNYDAPGADHLAPNGEWVELTNQGDTPVDLSGYTLRDERSHLYTFGPVVLAPNATLRLHSGRGADTAARLYWGLANDAVWNNDGDTAYLRDAAGTFVDAYAYSP
jgi:micrococcal nuclease